MIRTATRALHPVVRRFAAILAVATLSGCAAMRSAPDPALASLQRESLRHVYYRDNPLPPAPSAQEREVAQARLRAAEPWERTLLRTLYPSDAELWAYAVRDTDGDGILDFRISDYYGRFLEGDVDLDGDGVDNVLDVRPFEPSESAGGTAEIPAHVDWASRGKPSRMVAIQKELFVQHGVLLVERTAEFTPALAEALHDVVTRVYAAVFAERGRVPTLRVVATEESSLLDPSDEESAGDFAQVLPATGTLEVYRRGIEASPAVQLGFLAHEVAHCLQFALDLDEASYAELARHNAFEPVRFSELVEPFGWSALPAPLDPRSRYRVFRPQYIAEEPYGYRYLGRAPEEWEGWLAGIADQVGDDAYLTDPRVRELHIVGDYSLTSPQEWHGDQVIAYLYLTLLDSLAERCSPADWDALDDAFQHETVAVEWPYFRYDNARGAEVLDLLRSDYPMAQGDVRAMAERYVLGAHPRYCRER